MNGREQTKAAEPDMTLRDLRWPWFAAMVVSVATLAYIYWPTLHWWYRKWMEKESYYSHGILIPFISAFIIWLKRKELVRMQLKPSMWGLLLSLPFLLVQLVAHANSIPSVHGFTLPIVLIGASVFVFGKKMAWALLFPLAFLFFMCVLPSDILTKLSFRIQLLSTTVATAILNVLALGALQQGTSIELPNISIQVGAPCSGFRLLISLMAFAFLFAYLKQGPVWGRIFLVLVTVPLSVAVNSIRVALIALVGEFMGSDAMHTFHDYSGYIVLVLAFLFLMQFARLVKCHRFRPMLTS